MTEQPSMPYPAPVSWNWNNAVHEQQRAAALARNIPGLEERVNLAKRALADATRDLVEAERRQGEALHNAEVSRELVETWCSKHGRELPPVPGSKHGRELPPVPAEPPLHETTEFPVQKPQAQREGLAALVAAGQNGAPDQQATVALQPVNPTPCDAGRCEDCSGDRCLHGCHAHSAAADMGLTETRPEPAESGGDPADNNGQFRGSHA